MPSFIALPKSDPDDPNVNSHDYSDGDDKVLNLNLNNLEFDDNQHDTILTEDCSNR